MEIYAWILLWLVIIFIGSIPHWVPLIPLDRRTQAIIDIMKAIDEDESLTAKEKFERKDKIHKDYLKR